MYIKLRQIQTQEIEFSRDMEELLAIFPNDEGEDSYIEKNTDLPWKALFNEETLEMAARGNSVYFAENNLNNIITSIDLFMVFFFKNYFFFMLKLFFAVR